MGFFCPFLLFCIFFLLLDSCSGDIHVTANFCRLSFFLCRAFLMNENVQDKHCRNTHSCTSSKLFVCIAPPAARTEHTCRARTGFLRNHSFVVAESRHLMGVNGQSSVGGERRRLRAFRNTHENIITTSQHRNAIIIWYLVFAGGSSSENTKHGNGPRRARQSVVYYCSC